MKAFETISEAVAAAKRSIGHPSPYPVTEQVYWEAMEGVPPIYDGGAYGSAFWLGEPYCHDGSGRPVALECWRDGSRYWCRLSTVKGKVGRRSGWDAPAAHTPGNAARGG